jgi:DNA-binding SARP family transcriptional activator/predicted ATPase
MSTLDIRLFGRFQLARNGQPIETIYQVRQQSLLAYLLLYRYTSLTRQELTFLFWPDAPEKQAFANLRKALHRLRLALPDADRFLYVDARSLHWQPGTPFTLDVADFEQRLLEAETARRAGRHIQLGQALNAAVELYAGDLLPRCYDDWLLPERERLRQQFLQVLEQLISLQEEQHHYPAAILAASRLLRHDPLHEVTYCHLMRLHLLNDDPAEALRIYHTCATVLQRELGVSPSPATQEVYQRLLGRLRTPLSRPTDSPLSPLMLSLVNRQTEWRQLLAAWHRASRGQVGLVLIAGEAGIGKTRLAEELLTWADQQGITTARTRSYPSAGNLAYGPIAAWLNTEALQAGWHNLEKVWLTEIARLLPALLSQRPNLPHPEPLTESWQRNRLFEALARAVLKAAQPLLLVLDDLQWCDTETLAWLGYLLRFDPLARLLVVGTVRIEEISDDYLLVDLLRNLRQTGLVTEIEVGPLDRAETVLLAEQVAGRAIETNVEQQLYQDTGGNPLFIVETVRASQEEGAWRQVSSSQAVPPKVQAVIERRLAQLSPPARELVNLAAVIGREFTVELLAAASQTAEASLVNALDETWQRRILREQGQAAYDFDHDKFRDIAYAGLSPARRRWLHQSVARALDQLFTANLDQVSGRLAYHYEQAGQLEQAVRHYWQAAQVARNLCALTETIDFLQRGLALLERLPDTSERAQQELNFLAMLGATYAAQKGYAAPEAGRVYEQALTLTPKVGESLITVLVQFGLWVYHFIRADLSQAQAIAQEILTKAEYSNNPALLKIALHTLGFPLTHQGQVVQARLCLEQSLAQPTDQVFPHIPDLTGFNLSYLALVLWFLGYPDQALRQMNEAYRQARSQPDLVSRAAVTVWTTWLHYWLGNRPLVVQYAQEAIEHSTKYDLRYWQTVVRFYQNWAVLKQTGSRTTIANMRQALADFFATGAQLNLSAYLIALAEAYLEYGQIEPGLETIEQAIEHIVRTGEHLLEPEVYRLKGELLLAQSGDHQADAEACFKHALTITRDQQTKSLELRVAISLSRLWHSQGASSKREAARQLLTEIYAWFTEGFDTPDLKEANALLEALQ